MADPALVETLTTLSSQIDTLSDSLAPLLKVPFQELISQQDEPLVKAKLDVLVSYALHDLIWVYLKTSGVDPTTHPVMQEIERLKGYFAKLKSAEHGPQPGTPSTVQTADKRRMQIDKQAASRFINHAIASQKAKIDPDYTPGVDEDAEMGVGGSGIHTRFDEAEEGEDEDEVLQGVEKNEEVERLLDEEVGDEQEVEVEITKEKKKGKRKILDPFAGYDQPKPSPSTTAKRNLDSTTNSGASTPLKKKTSAEISAAEDVPAGSAGKKTKKKKDAKKLKMKK